MKKSIRIILILILIAALAFIRVFADTYFYDPLTLFFKHDYLSNPLPEINNIKLFMSVFIRYSLNAAISLLIIYVAFLKKENIVFLIWIYIISFLIFLIPFYFLLNNSQNEHHLLLFYVRRFLIQPLLLLLLLPAFYYFKTINN